MKRLSLFLLALLLTVTCGCGSKTEPETVPGDAPQAETPVELVDLTPMSGTVLYAQVSNIMSDAQNYLGKTIRITGQCASGQDETGVYHVVLVNDATACCAIGFEYLLPADDYPADGGEATVEGVFELYGDGGALYARLRDAVLIP